MSADGEIFVARQVTRGYTLKRNLIWQMR
jgi:hypothetical protein